MHSLIVPTSTFSNLLPFSVQNALDGMWEVAEMYPEDGIADRLAPSTENVEMITTFAHKLCYTTFAPPGRKVTNV